MYELNEHGSNDVLEQENEAVEYMEVDPNRSKVEFWEDALDDVLQTSTKTTRMIPAAYRLMLT